MPRVPTPPPYPARPIAEKWLEIGGKFTLSDDSHGIVQVATNYGRAIDFLLSLGVTEVWTLERTPLVGAEQDSKARLTDKAISLADVKASLKL